MKKLAYFLILTITVALFCSCEHINYNQTVSFDNPRSQMDQFKEIFSGHEAIDLGLPSGLLWATCDVGATKPEGYGTLYYWKDTKGIYWGGSWRLPTKSEMQELMDNCTVTKATMGGQHFDGLMVKGKNGALMLLTTAVNSSTLRYQYNNSSVAYWTSTESSTYPYYLDCDSYSYNTPSIEIAYATDQCSVRLVMEKR